MGASNYEQLKKGLAEFNRENRRFKYTKENWEKIQEYNNFIKEFHQNPEDFVDPERRFPPVERQLRIASIRAQITDYVEILEWEQKKIKDIEKQIAQKERELQRAKARSTLQRITDPFNQIEATLFEELKALDAQYSYYSYEKDFLTTFTTQESIRQQVNDNTRNLSGAGKSVLEAYRQIFENAGILNSGVSALDASKYKVDDDRANYYNGVQELDIASLLNESQLVQRMQDIQKKSPPNQLNEDYIDGLRQEFTDKGSEYQALTQAIVKQSQLELEVDKIIPRELDENPAIPGNPDEDRYIKRLEETILQYDEAINLSELQKIFAIPSGVDISSTDGKTQYIQKVKEHIVKLNDIIQRNTPPKPPTQELLKKATEEKNRLDELLKIREIAEDTEKLAKVRAYVEGQKKLVTDLQTTVQTKSGGESDESYIKRMREHLNQKRKLASTVVAYNQLPRQEILLELQALVPRNSGEDEKKYIQRLEDIKNLNPDNPSELSTLKTKIKPISTPASSPSSSPTVESDADYKKRIVAIKKELPEKLDEYKAQPELNRLSIESHAILDLLLSKQNRRGTKSVGQYLEKIKKIKTLYEQYQKAPETSTRSSVYLGTGEPVEPTKSYLLNKLQKIALPQQITEGGSTREETQEEYIKRIEDIAELYTRFEKSKSPSAKTQRLCLDHRNPIVNLTYNFGKLSQTIKFSDSFIQEHKHFLSALEMTVPKEAKSVVAGYPDGASLVLSRPNKDNEHDKRDQKVENWVISIPIFKKADGEVDREAYEKSEYQMIRNICANLDSMRNPILNLTNFESYGDRTPEAKPRFIQKLVQTYCLGEDGKVDIFRFNKIKNALLKSDKTQSAVLSSEEMFSKVNGKRPYEFLIHSSNLKKAPSIALQDTKLTKTHQLRLQLKKQLPSYQKVEEIEKNIRWTRENILGYSEDTKVKLAAAALKELKEAQLDNQNIFTDPKFSKHRLILKNFWQVDDLGFEKKYQEEQNFVPSAKPTHRGH